MERRTILLMSVGAGLVAVSSYHALSGVTPVQRQPQVEPLRVSDDMRQVRFMPVATTSLTGTADQKLHDWYVNERGMVFAVFKAATVGYLIRVFSPDGALIAEFDCTGSIWQPPVRIEHIAADRDGHIYAAVEWSMEQSGIIIVDRRGKLVSKLALSEFKPLTIAVDRRKRVWVAGWEVTLAGPGGVSDRGARCRADSHLR